MKATRHKKILEFVNKNEIETQEELAFLLKNAGYNVTQATISRDIKELGLIKIPSGENRYCYATPRENPHGNIALRLQRLFRDSVIGIDDSENIILFRTLPGTANAVASCIDNMEIDEIIGTLAGDDTVLAVVKPKNAVAKVMERFQSMMG